MGPRLKLVSFDLCPYVERSRIVLFEKDIPFELEFIDLAQKPAWFLAVSPMGRVPVLLVDDRPIFESMVINEFLEELHPQPSLFPKEPLPRAEARSWIVFANDVAMPANYAASLALAGGKTGEASKDALARLRDAYTKLEQKVERGGGPYFLGSQFTLVDAAYAPLFRRWREAETWGPAQARLLADFPSVSRYAEAVLERPSVVKAAPKEFGRSFRQFSAERALRANA